MKIQINGLISAPFTPMFQDGAVNIDVIPGYIDYLLNNGVDNVFILGTTSEGTSLNVEERKLVAETWLKFGKNKLERIIVHVGNNSIAVSKELAKHAEQIGADAVAMLPPCYFKPMSFKQVHACLKEVADSIPNVPIMYYHLPVFTGINFNMIEFLELACSNIPNFCGLKYSDADLKTFAPCLEKFQDKINLCFGNDESIFFALILGCEAFVGSTFNYCGKLCSKMLEAMKNDDIKTAKDLHFRILSVVGTVNGKGYDLGLQKQLASALSGIELGNPRLPLLPADQEGKKIIKKVIEMLKK